jgi:hypothetical protein
MPACRKNSVSASRARIAKTQVSAQLRFRRDVQVLPPLGVQPDRPDVLQVPSPKCLKVRRAVLTKLIEHLRWHRQGPHWGQIQAVWGQIQAGWAGRVPMAKLRRMQSFRRNAAEEQKEH